MLFASIGQLLAAAGAHLWPVKHRQAVYFDPQQTHLATLLLVGTSAYENHNNELYQATIKEIVLMMSEGRWKRGEIGWRMRQATLIAKCDSTPELFDKVIRVAQNIAHVTMLTTIALPWAPQPNTKLLTHTSLNSLS